MTNFFLNMGPPPNSGMDKTIVTSIFCYVGEPRQVLAKKDKLTLNGRGQGHVIHFLGEPCYVMSIFIRQKQR